MKQLVLLGCLLVPVSASAQIAPYPTAPLCSTHDASHYHGLWDDVRGCHYDHTHGANPHTLDDLLGTDLWDLFGNDGFGSPWATCSGTDPWRDCTTQDSSTWENVAKHAGYHWLVHDVGTVGDSDFLAFRYLTHQHAIKDAPVQFHFFALEALVKDPLTGELGTIREFGWMNCGHLVEDGVKVVTVPDAEPGRHKQHGVASQNQIWYCGNEATHDPTITGNGTAQYWRNLSLGVSAQTAFGGTEPTAPFLADLWFCVVQDTRCRANSTIFRPHLLNIHPVQPAFVVILDPDGDGWIDGTFYHDRYGVPRQVSECAAPGLDCLPFTFSHIRVTGGYSCSDTTGPHGLPACGSLYDRFDVLFNGRSSGWSQRVN